MKGTDVAEELKFEGKPKFAGIGLAKRTTEVRVLRDGEKPRRFSGTSTGEARREKLAGGHRGNGSLRLRVFARPVPEAADGVRGTCP